jgi:hypothetical protein
VISGPVGRDRGVLFDPVSGFLLCCYLMAQASSLWSCNCQNCRRATFGRLLGLIGQNEKEPEL